MRSAPYRAIRRFALSVLVITVLGTSVTAPGAGAVPGPDPTLEVSTWMSGLQIPWDVAFLPDGSALVTQRDLATILLRRPNGTVRQVAANLSDVDNAGEGGLMGVVVHPDFDRNRRFYTCSSTRSDVQVVAWKLRMSGPSARRVADPLVGGIDRNPSGRHSGCRLRFDHAGNLIIATGDAAFGTTPQDRNSLAGKTLRVDPITGRGVEGNPFIGRPGDDRIFTFGHRNVQGLDRRPCTSQMWTAEHGPSRDDEINLLRAGGNYGWNPVPGYNEAVPMTDNSLPGRQTGARWSSGSTTVAISGAGWLRGAQWGAWDGQLAGATLKDSRLMMFGFSSRNRFTGISIPSELDLRFGRLRTPVQGPDGALYVTSDSTGTIQRVAAVGAPTPGDQDIDGDGFDDLVVGAPGTQVGAAARAGLVVSFAGGVGGLNADRGDSLTQAAVGAGTSRRGDSFGSAVAYGDVDGDGTTDVVVSAPRETVDGRRSAGSVTVVCGRTDGLGKRASQTFRQGGDVPGTAASGARFGAAVALGDFDGDGYDDLAAGAPGQAVEGVSGAGSVSVLEGTAAGLRTDSAAVLDFADLSLPSSSRGLGAALATGDVNVDGFDDLVIAAPGGAGLVVLVPGSRRGLAPARAQVRTMASIGGGTQSDAGFGTALAMGDLDGDGDDDLAVGAPRAGGAGAVFHLEGGDLGLAEEGDELARAGLSEGDRFGAALAAGDLNGDGRDELAVGMPGSTIAGIAGAGRVDVYVGTPFGPDSLATFSFSQQGDVPGGPAAGNAMGSALRVGDFDADGRGDLAIAVPGAAVADATGAGVVVVLPGSALGPTTSGSTLLTQPGAPAGARLGAGL